MRYYLYALILCMVALFFCACQNNQSASYRIGLSQCSDDAWRTKMNEEMRRELIFHPEIELIIRSADDNSEHQSADIDRFIEERVDLLIVSPNEADGLTAAVSRAYDAGIPVVVADRRVNGDKYTAFIGGDNYQVGKLMAQYIREQLPRGGRIVEMCGLEGSTPAVWRHRGMMEGLQDANIEIISGNGYWFRDNAREEMARLLQQTTDIDMVMAHNDQMAIGAWEAANELLSGNKIRFVGVDALSGEGNGLEAIMQGKLEASVSYATEGGLLIQRAAQILAGEPFTRDTVLPAMLIDRDAAEPLVQLYRQEQSEVQTIDMLQQHIKLFTTQYRQQRIILWMIFVFAVVAVIFFVYYLRLYRQRKRLSEQLLTAQQELEQATRQKLTFYTNVSHDFRTPLTLIADPLRQLSHDSSLTEQQHSLAEVAERNAQVLLRLINQVLDLRKAESGKLDLHRSQVNLTQAISEWVNAFQPLAKKKHIHLIYKADATVFASVDIEKMERILFNLLSNAFKFTPENEIVEVRLWQDNEQCYFTVTDTGSGIPEEHKRRIFDSFYQIDTTNRQGSGIGLALVKTFVEMHGGKITVSDNPKGRGTVFTVMLPINNEEGTLNSNSVNSQIVNTDYVHITAEQILTELATEEESNANRKIVNEKIVNNVILVIDDNADIRHYIRSLFEGEYTVLTAKDGQAGLQKARQAVPDIVICDLSMPDIDGLEVCEKLKTEIVTSHIPVLMLTARSLDEQQVEGYEHGADAYLCKPFKAELLRAQVKALIENRKRVMIGVDARGETANAVRLASPVRQQNLTSNSANGLTPNSVTASQRSGLMTPDEQFIAHFQKIVLDKIDDEQLTVETIADDMAMSRTQLYRKIKSLTNYSPNELIRNLRLTEAHKMLLQTDLSISEIAYRTGFSSPSYFTKCYTDYFGKKPSEVK